MRFIFSISLVLAIFVNGTFAQDESLLGKDLTISLGATKNRFFEDDQFRVAVPIELPLLINYGVNKKIEFGVEVSPMIFNDRSNFDFNGIDSLRNHFGGFMQNYNGVLQYSVNNNYRFNGYMQATGGYSYLHKKQWIRGTLNELIGSGYNFSFGGGLRYQMGNMYDDVFPWFFDFSVNYTRYNLEISDYKIKGEQQPKSDNAWNDLKFGSIDVSFRIGYRFRKK